MTLEKDALVRVSHYESNWHGEYGRVVGVGTPYGLVYVQVADGNVWPFLPAELVRVRGRKPVAV